MEMFIAVVLGNVVGGAIVGVVAKKVLEDKVKESEEKIDKLRKALKDAL